MKKLKITNFEINKIFPNRYQLNKATKHFEEFIEIAFDNEGKHRQGYMLKNPSKQNCQYCPFKDRKDLCDKNVS